jgi:hypothetical protein
VIISYYSLDRNPVGRKSGFCDSLNRQRERYDRTPRMPREKHFYEYLAEWIEQTDAKLDLNEHVQKHWDGKKRMTWRYQFANGVPIKGAKDDY